MKTNKLPQMTGDTGYGIGFFCGCLVGAVGTYLALTPEGKQLKHKIYKEYQANRQTLTLESLLPENESKVSSPAIRSIQSALAALRKKIPNPANVKLTPPKVSTGSNPTKKHYFKKK